MTAERAHASDPEPRPHGADPAPSASASASASSFDKAPVAACWGTTLLALAILGVLTAQRALSEGTPLPPYLDTDTYSRMIRVLELWRGEGWFQPGYDRILPDGLVSHWTRPLDALIILLALPLSTVLPDTVALHWSGYVISPVLCLLSVLVLTGAMRPVMSGHQVAFTGLGLIFVLPVLAAFLPGRPDHYPPLLLVLTVIIWGLTGTMTNPRGRAGPVILGAALPLAIWVNISGVLLALGVPVLLGLRWWVAGETWAGRNQLVALSATIVGALALALERPPAEALTTVEFDRLSIAHVVIFAVILAFWSAVTAIERRRPGWSRGPVRRLPWAAGLAVVGVAGLLALFPQVMAPDRGIPIDPLYERTRLVHIEEYQPLVETADLRAIETALESLGRNGTYSLPLLFGGLGLIYLLLRGGRPGERWIWGGLLGLAGLYLAATWPPNGAWMTLILALLVPGYGAIAGGLFAALRGLDLKARIPARVGLLSALLLAPAGVTALATPESEERGPSLIQRCHFTELAQHLARVLPEQPRQNIMAFADMGPELMYWTPHAVYAIPNHRNQPGYEMIWRVLTAESAAAARETIKAADADVLILCAPRNTKRASETLETLAFRTDLIAGAVPAWLDRLALPAPLDEDLHVFRVFAPDHASPPGGTDRPASRDSE